MREHQSLSTQRAQVYVTSLPALGTLYYMDGRQFPNTSSTSPMGIIVPYNTTAKVYGLRYRPPWNAWSNR